MQWGKLQFSSITQSCPTLHDPMDCSMPGFPVRHQLPELTQTHVHQVSDAIQPSHPLSSPSLPTFDLSQYQSFQMSQFFTSGPSNEFSGLHSFRIDWLDLLAVQGTLKSLLQHHSSKASIFGTQLSLQFNSHIHKSLTKTILAKILKSDDFPIEKWQIRAKLQRIDIHIQIN